MSVLAGLRSCARKHLDYYPSPLSGRAFAAYDRQGDPHALSPVDVLAPGLLDAPIQGREVIAMFQPSGPYRDLLDAMRRVVEAPATTNARFEDQCFHNADGAWAVVSSALAASDATRGVKAAKVTKILHRKRPHLVPIFDSRVAAAYGVTARRPWLLWEPLQRDLINSSGWLTALAESYHAPDDRVLSTVRAADIIIWEHSWGC